MTRGLIQTAQRHVRPLRHISGELRVKDAERFVEAVV